MIPLRVRIIVCLSLAFLIVFFVFSFVQTDPSVVGSADEPERKALQSLADAVNGKETQTSQSEGGKAESPPGKTSKFRSRLFDRSQRHKYKEPTSATDSTAKETETKETANSAPIPESVQTETGEAEQLSVPNPSVSDLPPRDPNAPRITSHVYLDVSVDGVRSGRLILGLYGELLPRTTKNFEEICRGSTPLPSAPAGKMMTFAGSVFHRIIPGFMAQVRCSKEKKSAVVLSDLSPPFSTCV
uniref:Peptidyl-prolyl cis-trans isomerase n=1 Tax=Chromera velia CCMP2878 TaxID=1169474 RepID=A0A0G4FU62_9ALVE|eukprot:Cvel_18600.t1-p1 / transcript=Cvel_18600.t1 / gene=Cvel_18600 / organism=Chromera_velia_CCMP2878 / gene_product=Peptidyl-prolyl cis-trans isomerase CYP20-1, putative / transcript_product=Peptidyl-prolyl cis-trans isomerase CYP20-1, putative / location=Cvel_scaffold1552:554-1630(-) / protein_length=242 / sequence_SO=supercontig / SO=protein_coding / is_pseudo=false